MLIGCNTFKSHCVMEATQGAQAKSSLYSWRMIDWPSSIFNFGSVHVEDDLDYLKFDLPLSFEREIPIFSLNGRTRCCQHIDASITFPLFMPAYGWDFNSPEVDILHEFIVQEPSPSSEKSSSDQFDFCRKPGENHSICKN